MTIFQKRRAKQNLERDLNWNGPHDEDFFNFFEQYLDQAIQKMLHELKRGSDRGFFPDMMASPQNLRVLDQDVNITSKKHSHDHLGQQSQRESVSLFEGSNMQEPQSGTNTNDS